MSVERSPGRTDTPSSEVGDPIVTFDGVTKRFGRIVALADVSLSIERNEILGIIGDNGAGKSTLMNILSGVYTPTRGTVRFDGEPVTFGDPSEARERGVETVYQDLALMDDLDIATNVFLGRFPARRSIGPVDSIDWEQTYEEAERIISHLGQDLDVKSEVEFLSGGQRQLVAVARALLFDPEVIVFDEPTSALSVAGTAIVHDLIRQLQNEGRTQVVVSHNVEDVIDLADRIAVMYQGQVTEVVDPQRVDRDVLTELITTGELPDV